MVQTFQVAALAFPVSDGVIDEIQLRESSKILDREYGREDGLQPRVFALRRQQIHLQEALIRQALNLDQVRNLDRTLDLGKVQPLALPKSMISVTMISIFVILSRQLTILRLGRVALRAYTPACGPDWTQLKFKFPTVWLRTNSSARKASGAPACRWRLT